MNTEIEIRQVPFMGTELIAARDHDGQIWAGVRWMCSGIGLSKAQSKSQVEKINEDKVLSKGVGNFRLPTSGGMQDSFCLKLDFVPLWLAAAFLQKQYQTSTQRQEGAKKGPAGLPSLSSVNVSMKLQVDVARMAGVAPEYILATMTKAYDPYGIAIPLSSMPEGEKLYECDAIAKELGVLSEKGKPHSQAISAIISLVGTQEGEAKTVPFTLNGYSNTTVKYTASVLERVRSWLEENCYPSVIQGANGKQFRVRYLCNNAE